MRPSISDSPYSPYNYLTTTTFILCPDYAFLMIVQETQEALYEIS